MLHRLFQRLFFWCILNLEFHHDCIQVFFQWLHYYVIPSKSTFSVGSDSVFSSQINNQPKDKSMVKSFWFEFLWWFSARVETAECLKCYLIHKLVHIIQISGKQSIFKIAICRIFFCKPVLYHLFKHQHCLMICHFQIILALSCSVIHFVPIHFQISARKHKTPDGSPLSAKLFKNNLLIQFCADHSTV